MTDLSKLHAIWQLKDGSWTPGGHRVSEAVAIRAAKKFTAMFKTPHRVTAPDGKLLWSSENQPAPDGIPAERRSRFYVETVTPAERAEVEALGEGLPADEQQPADYDGDPIVGEPEYDTPAASAALGEPAWLRSKSFSEWEAETRQTPDNFGYGKATDTLTPPVKTPAIFDAVDSGRIQAAHVEWEKVARELRAERDEAVGLLLRWSSLWIDIREDMSTDVQIEGGICYDDSNALAAKVIDASTGAASEDTSDHV